MFALVAAVDNQKLWSWRAYRQLLTMSRTWRPDVILTSAPPWSPSIACVVLAARSNASFVFDLRDPWLGRGGIREDLDSGVRDWIDTRIERWVIGRAQLVSCSSARLATKLRQRYPEHAPRIAVIRNGFSDEDRVAPPTGTGLRLLYAGTIYFNRNPMPLLEGLRLLVSRAGVDRKSVNLTMVGECSSWRGVDLGHWTEANGLGDCLRFLPPVRPDEVRRLTAESNVLVNFAQGQPDQVPAKLFEQIAANRSVLLFTEQDSESALCVADLDYVKRLDDDPAAVADELERLYHRAESGALPGDAVSTLTERYSRDSSNGAFLERMMDLVGTRLS